MLLFFWIYKIKLIVRAKTVNSKCYVFDFDDTLIKSAAKIKVYKNNVFVRALTPKQFNFYKSKPGEKLDFKDFIDGNIIFM